MAKQRSPRSQRKNRLNAQNLFKTARSVTAIGRHALDDPATADLTSEGRDKSRWSGKKIPSTHFLIVRSGTEPARVTSTAREILDNFPGKKSQAIELSEALKLEFIKDYPAWRAMVAERGKQTVMDDWMEGKIPTSILEKPEAVGIRRLKDIMDAEKNLDRTQLQGLKPFIANVTISWVDYPLLKVLGLDYRKIVPSKKLATKNPPKPGQTLRFTEAMLFFHMPDGRIILRYRGKPFDVTKKLKELGF